MVLKVEYFWLCLNPSVGITACLHPGLVGCPLPLGNSGGKHMEARPVVLNSLSSVPFMCDHGRGPAPVAASPPVCAAGYAASSGKEPQ